MVLALSTSPVAGPLAGREDASCSLCLSLMAAGSWIPLLVLPWTPSGPSQGLVLGYWGAGDACLPAFPITWVLELSLPAPQASSAQQKPPPCPPLPHCHPRSPSSGDVSLRGGGQIPHPREGRTSRQQPRLPPPSSPAPQEQQPAGTRDNGPPSPPPHPSWHWDREFGDEP